MGMTLKELLTKGEGTLSAQEAKTLAAQCRMDVETLYTLLEERGIKIIEDEADADVNLDVDSIIAEVENAENNSDELSLGGDDEEEATEENPADLKAAMDELLDDPVKNYLKQIGQIPLLSAEQEVDLSKRIHAAPSCPYPAGRPPEVQCARVHQEEQRPLLVRGRREQPQLHRGHRRRGQREAQRGRRGKGR